MNKLVLLALLVVLFVINTASTETVQYPVVANNLPRRKLLNIEQSTNTATPTPTPSSAPGSGWNVPFNGTVCPSGQPRKSRLATFLLSFFAGGVAVDRFYTGYIWQGVLKLIFPTFGIWWLVDVILYGKGDLPNADGCALYPDM
jgi:TM2 domain-containing membrane protein YozV